MPPPPRPAGLRSLGLFVRAPPPTQPCPPRQLHRAHVAAAPYSAAAATSADPIVRVTDVPAPHSGHIRVLELNRPAARNAISRALLESLRSHIDAVAAQYDPATGAQIVPDDGGGGSQAKATRALVIGSAVDSSFCAGADLKERRTFTPEETAQFLARLRDTLAALAALPVPTVAAVSSLALGGGLELALAAHMRVLTSNAVVGLPETRLGIIPGAGGTFRLPALIGVARARDLVLTGRRVSAPEAYFLGIADRLVEVVPESDEEGVDAQAMLARARREALNEAVRLAMEISEGGPVAVRAALRAVQEPSEAVECAMYDRVVRTEDRDEALRAFAEKRKPMFRGR